MRLLKVHVLTDASLRKIVEEARKAEGERCITTLDSTRLFLAAMGNKEVPVKTIELCMQMLRQLREAK